MNFYVYCFIFISLIQFINCKSNKTTAVNKKKNVTRNQKRLIQDKKRLLTTVNDTKTNNKRYFPSLNGTVLFAAALEDDVTSVINASHAMKELMNADQLIEAKEVMSFAMDIWLILSEVLNFKTKFIVVNEKREQSTSYEKLKNLVREKAANLTMTPIPNSVSTVRTLRFSHPIDADRYRIFIGAPRQGLDGGVSGIFKIFTFYLWIAIAIFIIVFTLTLIAIETTGRYFKLSGYIKSETPSRDNGQIFFVIWGNLCYQGAITIASACSGRIIIFTSLIFAYFIFNCFTSGILVNLSAVSFQLPFESLSDLSTKQSHRLVFPYDTNLIDILETIRNNSKHSMHDTWIRLLGKQSITSSGQIYENVTKILEQSCTENIAVFDTDTNIHGLLLRKAPCSIIKLRPKYFNSDLALVFHPQLPYQKIMIKALNRMREVGLIDKWQQHWDYFKKVSSTYQSEKTSFKAIQFKDIFAYLFIYTCGVVVSIGLLVMELIISHITHKINNYKNNKTKLTITKQE